MDRRELLAAAERLMKSKRGHSHRETGFEFYHGCRTAKLALQLRKRVLRDGSFDDVIFTGALFHDVGKGEEPHEKSGEAIVRRELVGLVSLEELERISQIVRLHDRRGAEARKYPDDVRIVQDADLIDHDGTIDVWMNFWYNACENWPMETSIKTFDSLNVPDQPLRQELLNYEESRRIQAKRFDFERLFFERFRREASGLLD